MLQWYDNLWNQLQQRERVTRWITYAAVLLVLFLIWDQVIYKVTESYRVDADRIESRARQVNEVADSDWKGIDRVVEAVGAVELPGNTNQGRSELLDAVNEILPELNITADDFDVRGGRRLPSSAMRGVGDGRRIELLDTDLRFETTPEKAIAAISALESSRAIERVTSVHMTKSGAGTIEVRLSLQAWVQSSGGRR